MLKHICYIFFILNFVNFAHSEGIYTIFSPGTLRSYFKYNVAITLHEAKGPSEIEVNIFSSNFDTSKVINMMPMSTANVELEMPKLEQGNYWLSVRGISGVTFENSTNLKLETYDPLIFIQLDKSVYKPGDLVQFRVIFLDEKTKPEHLKKTMTIYVKDFEFNTMQQWKNITLTHGVYTGNFQLSEQRVRDLWYIEVHDGKEALQQKPFSVIKSDLPAFEVSLDVPDKVAQTDESIRISISAKYTYGKPVKGKATVSINYKVPGGAGIVKKTFPIDGTAHVEFKIWQDLPKPEQILQEKKFPVNFFVDAYVEEELTGRNQSAWRDHFQLYEHNIRVEVLGDSDRSYHTGELITYELISRKFDGSPIQYNRDAVKLQIGDFEFYGTFNESGVATFKFMLPETYPAYIYCEYLGVKTKVGYLTPIEVIELPPERFQLNIITQNPQLRKDLIIEIKWNEPINYFVYILVGRGNIIKVERIEVPISSRSYIIAIKPTLEMIPVTSILVKYIYNDNLRFEEKSVRFEEDFQNTINISATAETSPGNDVEITISTDPNSYVGILGIDQSILLYSSYHEFEKHAIFSDMRRYDTKTPRIHGSGRYPGQLSGLVSMTNAHFPWSTRHEYYSAHRLDTNAISVGIRSKFPETWIFENFNVTNQTHFSFVRKIPDTITTWVLTGFSMNSHSGFALTENPMKILSYKPFFITINLPYSVKQGEVISIPVLVFNYMQRKAYVDVIMDNADGEFDFVKATNNNEVITVQRSKSYKRISIPKNSANSVSFLIRPKVLGMLTLKVTALTALAGDIVHRILKVEPEGITQYRNLATLINLNDKHEQREIFTVDLPVDNLVPHSEHLEFSAVGDIMGLSVKYLENLVRLPVGYGEQNMINFVPSILVLKYLQAVDRKMSNVTKTALNILKIGFQRELNFRHDDGSYSAYGHADRDLSYAYDDVEIVGSTWLTAYVVRFFQQAAEFIDIDEQTITKSLEFLVEKQTTNGNFAEFGHLLEFPYLNDESLTAFVLLAFSEKKDNFPKYKQYIKKGVEYLMRSLEDSDDLYALSITALVLQKFQHPKADEMLTKLKAVAKNENGFTYWTTADSKQRTKRMSRTFKSTDIEITAYILQAMLEKDAMADVLPVVKWLTMQRNSNGGFTSTQDTVVGLLALVRFAEKTGISRAGLMDIEYVCEGNGVEDEGTITIKPDNLMVLNTYELPKNTRKVRFTARGNSSSLVQLSYSYNIVNDEPEQSFRLGVNVRENTPPKQLILDVCVKFVPTDGVSEGNRTNMVVVEIALPSGYTIDSEELENLRDFKTVLFTETKKSDTLAIVYLQSLEIGHEKCISIEAIKMYEIARQKPVPVAIYDYNNKDLSATKYYGVKSSLCDICEAENCIVDCKKSETESPAFELS